MPYLVPVFVPPFDRRATRLQQLEEQTISNQAMVVLEPAGTAIHHMLAFTPPSDTFGDAEPDCKAGQPRAALRVMPKGRSILQLQIRLHSSSFSLLSLSAVFSSLLLFLCLLSISLPKSALRKASYHPVSKLCLPIRAPRRASHPLPELIFSISSSIR